MTDKLTDCDILYFIEHPSRELDTATAVKYFCEKKFNLRVVILSLPLGFRDATHKYRAKVAVFPFLISSDIKFYYQGGYYINHWKNVTYFNLNFEQYFYSANRSFKAPKDDFARSRVYQQAWSNAFRDYLVEFGVDPAKIFVNGNSNFMLYREPYRKLYANKIELGRKYELDHSKAWILLAENYGWAFLSDRELNTRIDHGFERSSAYRCREVNKQNISKVLRWLHDLCADRNNIEIILRPRPAVSIAEWKDTIEKEIGHLPSGLHIIKNGTIKEWILSSDIVLSSVSTCLMDAVVADKPAYILEPVRFPQEFVPEWFDKLDHLTSYEEFLSTVDKPVFNRRHAALRDDIIVENLANGDPIQNLAGYLSTLVMNHRGEAVFIPSRFDSIRHLYRRAAAVKGAIVGAFTGEPVGSRFESDKIEDRDIMLKMSRWGEVLS
ncbi:MAG: hypothetical protein JXA30_14830 [Deltaproteobacteria bacterium]|nr:hypothetical protein [Deltaproteobacteria bacterium]